MTSLAATTKAASQPVRTGTAHWMQSYGMMTR